MGCNGTRGEARGCDGMGWGKSGDEEALGDDVLIPSYHALLPVSRWRFQILMSAGVNTGAPVVTAPPPSSLAVTITITTLDMCNAHGTATPASSGVYSCTCNSGWQRYSQVCIGQMPTSTGSTAYIDDAAAKLIPCCQACPVGATTPAACDRDATTLQNAVTDAATSTTPARITFPTTSVTAQPYLATWIQFFVQSPSPLLDSTNPLLPIITLRPSLDTLPYNSYVYARHLCSNTCYNSPTQPWIPSGQAYDVYTTVNGGAYITPVTYVPLTSTPAGSESYRATCACPAPPSTRTFDAWILALPSVTTGPLTSIPITYTINVTAIDICNNAGTWSASAKTCTCQTGVWGDSCIHASSTYNDYFGIPCCTQRESIVPFTELSRTSTLVNGYVPLYVQEAATRTSNVYPEDQSDAVFRIVLPAPSASSGWIASRMSANPQLTVFTFRYTYPAAPRSLYSPHPALADIYFPCPLHTSMFAADTFRYALLCTRTYHIVARLFCVTVSMLVHVHPLVGAPTDASTPAMYDMYAMLVSPGSAPNVKLEERRTSYVGG